MNILILDDFLGYPDPDPRFLEWIRIRNTVFEKIEA